MNAALPWLGLFKREQAGCGSAAFFCWLNSWYLCGWWGGEAI